MATLASNPNTGSRAVLNKPQLLFAGTERPTWAITHFLPLYDPALDQTLHNEPGTGQPFEIQPIVQLVPDGSDLNFSDVRGQRIWKLPDMVPLEPNKPDGRMLYPRWKFYNSIIIDPNDANQKIANPVFYGGINIKQNETGELVPEKGCESIPKTFFNLNVIEYWDSPRFENDGTLIRTEVPPLNNSPVMSPPEKLWYLSAFEGWQNIWTPGDNTSTPPVAPVAKIIPQQANSFDQQMTTIEQMLNNNAISQGVFMGTMAQYLYDNVSYQPSMTPANETNKVLNGRFIFNLECPRGNYKYNKIVFFLARTNMSTGNNVRELDFPMFLGHYGSYLSPVIFDGNTPEQNNNIVSSAKVTIFLNYNSETESATNTIVQVVNSNVWAETMSPDFIDPFRTRYVPTFELGMNPAYTTPPPDYTGPGKLEDLSSMYAGMIYGGVVGIGELGIPSEAHPMARLQVTKRTPSYVVEGGLPGAQDKYVWIESHLPHIRLSDKTYESGLDIRFSDILTQRVDNNFNLPEAGIMTIRGSVGHIDGLGIAIGENAFALGKKQPDVLFTDNGNDFAIAIGKSAYALGRNSFALGRNARVVGNFWVPGQNDPVDDTFAIGLNAFATQRGIAIGKNTRITLSDTLSFNFQANDTTTPESHAFGEDSLADLGLAMGRNARARGRYIKKWTDTRTGETYVFQSGSETRQNSHQGDCQCPECRYYFYNRGVLLLRDDDCVVTIPTSAAKIREMLISAFALSIGQNTDAISTGIALGMNVTALNYKTLSVGWDQHVTTESTYLFGEGNYVGGSNSSNKDILVVGKNNTHGFSSGDRSPNSIMNGQYRNANTMVGFGNYGRSAVGMQNTTIVGSFNFFRFNHSSARFNNSFIAGYGNSVVEDPSQSRGTRSLSPQFVVVGGTNRIGEGVEKAIVTGYNNVVYGFSLVAGTNNRAYNFFWQGREMTDTRIVALGHDVHLQNYLGSIRASSGGLNEAAKHSSIGIGRVIQSGLDSVSLGMYLYNNIVGVTNIGRENFVGTVSQTAYGAQYGAINMYGYTVAIGKGNYGYGYATFINAIGTDNYIVQNFGGRGSPVTAIGHNNNVSNRMQNIDMRALGYWSDNPFRTLANNVGDGFNVMLEPFNQKFITVSTTSGLTSNTIVNTDRGIIDWAINPYVTGWQAGETNDIIESVLPVFSYQYSGNAWYNNYPNDAFHINSQTHSVGERLDNKYAAFMCGTGSRLGGTGAWNTDRGYIGASYTRERMLNPLWDFVIAAGGENETDKNLMYIGHTFEQFAVQGHRVVGGRSYVVVSFPDVNVGLPDLKMATNYLPARSVYVGRGGYLKVTNINASGLEREDVMVEFLNMMRAYIQYILFGYGPMNPSDSSDNILDAVFKKVGNNIENDNNLDNTKIANWLRNLRWRLLNFGTDYYSDKAGTPPSPQGTYSNQSIFGDNGVLGAKGNTEGHDLRQILMGVYKALAGEADMAWLRENMNNVGKIGAAFRY